MTKIQFLRRAEQIRLSTSSREAMVKNQENLDLLETLYGPYFQVHQVEAILSGKPSTTKKSQFHPIGMEEQTVYQQASDHPQVVYYTQPNTVSKKAKSQNGNGLITSALAAAIIMVLFAAFSVLRSGKSIDPTDMLFGSLTSDNSRPADAPTSCGGDIPNTFLNFGEWTSDVNGVKYFVPGNSPALLMEPSAVCFNVDKMNRFYSQTDIALKSGVVTGQEAFVRAILGSTVKSNIITNTDPRFQAVYKAIVAAVSQENFRSFEDPAFAKYGYMLLPGLGEFANTQPTATPTYVQPTQKHEQPVIPTSTPAPPTQAVAMAMEVLENTPTSMPAPTMQAVYEQNNIDIATLSVIYDSPTITPGAPTFPPVSFVSLEWIISSGKAIYGACSPIPNAESFNDYSYRWPMDGAVQIYIGFPGCGEGDGDHYQVDFRPYADRHVVDPSYRSIHISSSPNPNWGPAYQIPGTSYYIQPFNP